MLAELTERLGTASTARCTFHRYGPVEVHDSIVATHLCHIAREACINALKHAQAQEVQVHFRESDGIVTLQINDDGVGIPAEPTQGLGMKIMPPPRHRGSVEHWPGKAQGHGRYLCLAEGTFSADGFGAIVASAAHVAWTYEGRIPCSKTRAA